MVFLVGGVFLSYPDIAHAAWGCGGHGRGCWLVEHKPIIDLITALILLVIELIRKHRPKKHKKKHQRKASADKKPYPV